MPTWLLICVIFIPIVLIIWPWCVQYPEGVMVFTGIGIFGWCCCLASIFTYPAEQGLFIGLTAGGPFALFFYWQYYIWANNTSNGRA